MVINGFFSQQMGFLSGAGVMLGLCGDSRAAARDELWGFLGLGRRFQLP